MSSIDFQPCSAAGLVVHYILFKAFIHDINDIRTEVDRARGNSPAKIQDLGLEEHLSVINSLPVGLPLLLVDLMEVQNSEETNDHFLRANASSALLTPSETSEGDIMEGHRIEMEEESIIQAVIEFFCDGLTLAENSLLSKGLSFCPIPEEIDIFALKKDIAEYVRRLRLKEFFYDDQDVDGDFFRNTCI